MALERRALTNVYRIVFLRRTSSSSSVKIILVWPAQPKVSTCLPVFITCFLFFFFCFLFFVFANRAAALDPKPYIRTFEAALQQLQRIQLSAMEKEANASKEVEKTEILHSQEVINISHNFAVRINNTLFYIWNFIITWVERIT